jgi:hypothetical protein
LQVLFCAVAIPCLTIPKARLLRRAIRDIDAQEILEKEVGAMETKPGNSEGRRRVLQSVAFLFVVGAAITFGWVVGRGGRTEAFASQEKGTAPVEVAPEVSAPPMPEQSTGTVSARKDEDRAAKPAAQAQPSEPHETPAAVPGDGAGKEKPKVDLAAAKTERGEASIIRWSGPAAPALGLLEQEKPQDVLTWLKDASLDASVRANLNGRALLATKDVPGARAAFQSQAEAKGEAGADACFGLALCAVQGDVKAIPQAALEDLFEKPITSWGCAMAALEYARRLDVGLLDYAVFEGERTADPAVKGKSEELTRYYYQQALLTDRLLLADERDCQKRLQELTERIILNPRRNHLGFGLPAVNFHKVEPGDSLTKIAKQYEVTIGSICQLNGQDPKGVLLAGKTLKVVRGEVTLKVDRARLTATLLVDGAYLLRGPVGIGPGEKTPAGRFTIRTKVIKPDWYYNGKRVPFGDPENILGTRWLGFDTEENGGFGAGLGLHGTTIPESVPGRESLGCVRLHNADVEFIYAFLPQGGVVEIR